MANRNPSPKARFLESSDNIKKHHAMVETREFERACDFALAEYQRQMAMGPVDSNPNLALAAHYKQMGAVEFVHILKNLADVPDRPAPRPSDQLDHHA